MELVVVSTSGKMHQTASGGRLTRASSASPPLGSALHGPHAATWLVSTPPSKMLNGNHIVLAQISNLVSQITKRNYRQTSQELSLVRLKKAFLRYCEYFGVVFEEEESLGASGEEIGGVLLEFEEMCPLLTLLSPVLRCMCPHWCANVVW